MTDRKLITMTLALARKYAQPAQVLNYINEALETEIQGMGLDPWGITLAGCTRITQTELFYYGFDSDEIAGASLYSFDGAEFMLSQKYGDRTDWNNSIINRAVYVEFVKFIAELSIAQRLAEISADDNPDDIALAMKNDYVAFTQSDADVGVHILNPKWGSFQWLFRDHIALYGGEPVEFVRWANDLPSWKQVDGEPDVVLKFPDGTERAVAGIEVAFILKQLETP
jgi:hypothetical protein